MDPSLSEVRTQYMPDGLHPNAAGHEKIAAVIAKELTNIVICIPGNENHQDS
jgi:lysophospholipase L1-like esterase